MPQSPIATCIQRPPQKTRLTTIFLPQQQQTYIRGEKTSKKSNLLDSQNKPTLDKSSLLQFE